MWPWQEVIQYCKGQSEQVHPVEVVGIMFGILWGYLFIAGITRNQYKKKLGWDNDDAGWGGALWLFTLPFVLTRLLPKKSQLPKAKVIK